MNQKTINAYVCPSGHRMVTRDVDHGTTPMTVTCRECVAINRKYVSAYSQYYNVDQSLEATHEFYKPAHPERITDAPTRQHCEKGGLLLREVGAGDYTVGKPIVKREIKPLMKFSEPLTNVKR